MEIGKLRWRCRRGMKELDVMLEAYLEQVHPQAGSEQRAVFERLLELPDPQLYSMLNGHQECADPVTRDVIETIRYNAHH